MAQRPSSFTKRIDKLAKNVNAAARQYGQSRVTISLRLLSLYWHRGFRPGEALKIGLANPMIEQGALRACFTKSELMALQNELNPRELISTTEDKSVFASYFRPAAFPLQRISQRWAGRRQKLLTVRPSRPASLGRQHRSTATSSFRY